MISLKIIVKDVIFKGKNISIVCRLKVIYFPLTKSKFFFFRKQKFVYFQNFLFKSEISPVDDDVPSQTVILLKVMLQFQKAEHFISLHFQS